METQANTIIDAGDPGIMIKGLDGKNQGESSFKWWSRRILLGKDEEQEKQEKENHKHLNLFKKEVRRHLAEFIGTLFIVLFIAGIQVNQDRNPNAHTGNVDKGLVASFLLVGLIYCFGKVSGAHFNPCVTLAFLLRGHFGWLRTITYIIAQFAGCVVGAAILDALFGNIGGLGTTTPVNLSERNAFGVEILITFLLISVILSTSEKAQILGPTSGIAVGLTFGSLELWAWNFSGASANPWRTIGPTLISGYGWHSYWVYIIGPIVGTFLAVLVQRIMVTGIKHEDSEGSGAGQGNGGSDEDDKKEK